MPRTVTTSKEKTYQVDYCGVGYMGYLKTQIRDSRLVGEIAPEFEGLETVTYRDGEEETTFEGYTRLRRADRIDDVSVVILMERRTEDAGN